MVGVKVLVCGNKVRVRVRVRGRVRLLGIDISHDF